MSPIPYTTPRTWIAADVLTAAQLNTDVRDNVAFLANPPRCEASRSTVQSIATATWTLLTFNVEVQDTDGMFTVASGDQITIVTAGKYLFTFSASFEANTTGRRIWAIATGTTLGQGLKTVQTHDIDAGDNAASMATEISLAAAATVSFQVWQDSGGNLNVYADGAATACRATARWVAIN